MKCGAKTPRLLIGSARPHCDLKDRGLSREGGSFCDGEMKELRSLILNNS
jgi:hypothetical protein